MQRGKKLREGKERGRGTKRIRKDKRQGMTKEKKEARND